MVEDIESVVFKTKSICWAPNHLNNILLQNKNGPCFLISLINSLILSHELQPRAIDDFDDDDDEGAWTTVNNHTKKGRKLTTRSDNSSAENLQPEEAEGLETAAAPAPPCVNVTRKMLVPLKSLLAQSQVKLTDLLNELTALLLTVNNSDQDLSEILDKLPLLHAGLDINPNFNDGKISTKENPVIGICDILQIKVVHGWLLSDEDRVGIMNEISDYEQLQEIQWKTIDRINELDKETKLLDDLQLQKTSECNIALARLQQQQQPQQDHSPILEQLTKLTQINRFLMENATQLTPFGLSKLQQSSTEQDIISNDEFAIFFRNNHFNTIYKKSDQLYILLTDEGYLKAFNKSLVWQSLTSVNGSDDQLLLGDFTPLKDGSDINYNAYDLDEPDNENENDDPAKTADQLLAMSLQQQEDETYAKDLQREYNQVAKNSSTATSKKKKSTKKKKPTTATTTSTTANNTTQKPVTATNTTGKEKDACIIM